MGGLVHFGRMIDKIRAHQRGELPEEYLPNLGLSVGLDGMLCSFLTISFEAVRERVSQGGTDEEILEWCFTQTGFRPTKMQSRIWNEFARKLGWNDVAARFIDRVRAEEGITRADLQTSFDLIDYREGRLKSGESAE